MEDQTQTTQSMQDQTVTPVDTTLPQTDTQSTQQETPPIEQTPAEVAPVDITTAPVDEVTTEPKKLTGADVLASYGLVEIYDARLGAFCQVKKEDAQKMLESLDSLRIALGV